MTMQNLIGFAAIFARGTSTLVPEWIKENASLRFRALIATTLALLMIGAVAGVFCHRTSILFGH